MGGLVQDTDHITGLRVLLLPNRALCYIVHIFTPNTDNVVGILVNLCRANLFHLCTNSSSNLSEVFKSVYVEIINVKISDHFDV